MKGFSHGYHGQRYCSRARTHDGDDGGGGYGVAQDGGHTPTNRLTETCSGRMPSFLGGIFKEK